MKLKDFDNAVALFGQRETIRKLLIAVTECGGVEIRTTFQESLMAMPTDTFTTLRPNRDDLALDAIAEAIKAELRNIDSDIERL